MENNSDRMGFALIALSVVAFVLLAVNGPLKSTVNGFFNGFNTWQTQTVNGISETNKPDVTHTAYANIVSLCNENSNFTLSEASLVRYGSDSRWVYKELQAGTYTATNTFFGSDPASGTFKHVELVSNFSTVYPNLNLLEKTNQGTTNWDWSMSDGDKSVEDVNIDGIRAVKLTKGTTTANTSWNYIPYYGLLRNLIKPNTQYVLSFDVKPSVDVSFSATLIKGNYQMQLTDSVSMNKALANQWTKVSCVLTSKSTLQDVTSQVVYLTGMPTTNGNWLIIKNIKLEEGNIPTPYMPSASEVKSSDQPKYIGTYTDKNDSASQDPSDYTWKLNPDYHE